MKRRVLAGLLSVLPVAVASAQTLTRPSSDVAVTFIADRTNRVYGESSWLKGGAAELGVNARHGLGLAVRVSGVTTTSLTGGTPLNLVLVTFGPRYRVRLKHVSVYGEAMGGIANGFGSVFPTATHADTSASGSALTVGGGLDVSLTKQWAIRAVEANWTRTTLPNGTTDTQNHLQLGSGVVLRF